MKQCPYCLKEISEFSIQCPHCGESLNDKNIDYAAIFAESQVIRKKLEKYKEEKRAKALKKIGNLFILIVAVLFLGSGIFFIIYNKIGVPMAEQYLNEGEYEKAYSILKAVPVPKNDYAQELLTEIRNESCILSAREATIERIKNDNEDNSLQDGEWDYILEENTFYDDFDGDDTHPIIVLKICVYDVKTSKPYRTYYSVCVNRESPNGYISLGICLYSRYHDPINPRASDAESAYQLICFWEDTPPRKSVQVKYNSTRLSKMCSSTKKIDVLE